MKNRRGFTLVEILVVVSLVAVLAAMIVPNINAGSAQARDAERQAKVLEVQVALERYHQDNGRYPDGCNTGSAGSDWQGLVSGQPGSGYDCASNPAEYIPDLVPNYITRLPIDQNLPGTAANEGYVYITNPDGTVYKFMALNTVEEEIVLGTGVDTHPLASCGNVSNTNIAECGNVRSGPGVPNPYNTVGGLPPQCAAAEIANDYAISSGYATRGSQDGSTFLNTEPALEYYSDAIRCWGD